MSGLVLRLAGPLQSWGEHSTFAERDTQRFPTRSGLIGMFAAAGGIRRGESLDDFNELKITVRIDRQGVAMTDFHTVGGGYPRDRTVPKSEGGRRTVETATMVTRRRYLADAVFVVGVSASSQMIESLFSHLVTPRWQPYLGRRSCPPDQPMLLRVVDDPLAELTERVPLARRLPPENEPRQVDFVLEGVRDDKSATTELMDVPANFDRFERRYRPRTISVTPVVIPEHLWLGAGRLYQQALFDYVGGSS